MEYTNQQLIEYNNIASVVMNNVLAEKQRMGDIILWDFQPDQDMDRLYYNVAALTSDVLGLNIYLDLPFIDYLKFKWKRRKGRKNIRRVNKKIKNRIGINDRTSIYEIMMFIQKELELDNYKFGQVNEAFYGWV